MGPVCVRHSLKLLLLLLLHSCDYNFVHDVQNENRSTQWYKLSDVEIAVLNGTHEGWPMGACQ